jgi:hypothetical protein
VPSSTARENLRPWNNMTRVLGAQGTAR